MFPNEFERINNNTLRLKVPGGWLVNVNSYNIMFIEDPKFIWEVKPYEKPVLEKELQDEVFEVLKKHKGKTGYKFMYIKERINPNIKRTQLTKTLNEMVEAGLIVREERDHGVYYRIDNDDDVEDINSCSNISKDLNYGLGRRGEPIIGCLEDLELKDLGLG